MTAPTSGTGAEQLSAQNTGPSLLIGHSSAGPPMLAAADALGGIRALAADEVVVVTEAGSGRYAQQISAGRHVFTADEPASIGGDDTGPNPYDSCSRRWAPARR